MMRVVRAEWRKLMRRGQLWGSWGTMAGFGVLLAVLLVATAKDVAAVEQEVGGNPTIPIGFIEASDGLVFAFQASGQLLGVVALVIAAANLSTEYGSGTLRMLLVREPRRVRVLLGKLLALWGFVALGVLLALVACGLASAAVAAARGIDVGAWASLDAARHVLAAVARVGGTALVWTTLGLMLAALFRAGFPAIGVGIGFPLIAEGLLVLVMPEAVQWFPGTILAQLAQGGTTGALDATTSAVDHGVAVAMAVAYGLLFTGVGALLVWRRDVA